MDFYSFSAGFLTALIVVGSIVFAGMARAERRAVVIVYLPHKVELSTLARWAATIDCYATLRSDGDVNFDHDPTKKKESLDVRNTRK